MQRYIWIFILLILCMTSCTNNVCETKDFKWIYYDKVNAEQGLGALYRYVIWVRDDSIFVQSENNNCNVLNEKGIMIASYPFNNDVNQTSLK